VSLTRLEPLPHPLCLQPPCIAQIASASGRAGPTYPCRWLCWTTRRSGRSPPIAHPNPAPARPRVHAPGRAQIEAACSLALRRPLVQPPGSACARHALQTHAHDWCEPRHWQAPAEGALPCISPSAAPAAGAAQASAKTGRGGFLAPPAASAPRHLPSSDQGPFQGSPTAAACSGGRQRCAFGWGQPPRATPWLPGGSRRPSHHWCAGPLSAAGLACASPHSSLLAPPSNVFWGKGRRAAGTPGRAGRGAAAATCPRTGARAKGPRGRGEPSSLQGGPLCVGGPGRPVATGACAPALGAARTRAAAPAAAAN
jgi:hypothetical protein